MYSTKLLNKSMVAGNAYITVGDPYKAPDQNPFRQGKKDEKLTPFRTTLIPKNAENGNFAKLAYKAGGYMESNKYKDSQPLDTRKNGFGSKDAHRRDEFTNNIRTEQYRETLRKEKELTAEAPEKVEERLTKLLAERTMSESNQFSQSKWYRTEKVHQFDIGRTRTTDFDPKSTKDKFYRFDQDDGKEFGTFNKPVSTEVGDNAWNTHYKPPSFGGKSEVKNFYDKSHLNVTSY